MGQLPFRVRCGTDPHSQSFCAPGSSPFYDGTENGGVATVFAAGQDLTICAAPIVDNKAPPNARSGSTWNPARLPDIGYPPFDAAHPPDVGPGDLPLPPHCWGWEGSTDFCKLTYYPLAGTIAEVVDAPGHFCTGQAITVTAEYDVVETTRMTQRKLTYSRVDFLHGFDFSTSPVDVCTDLAALTSISTHVKQVIVGPDAPSGSSRDLGSYDTDSHNKQDGSGYLTSARFWTTEYQDSSYFDPSVSNGQLPKEWGSFSQGYGDDRLHWDVIYQFGRKTRTVSNLKFTISASWRQQHCNSDTGGGGPCNCNKDCPPCTGGNGILHSGKCISLCASPGVDDGCSGGWTITDQYGATTATSHVPNGWVVNLNGCSLSVCAPCLSREKLLANDYQGPYSLVWCTGDTCICNNQRHYKVYSAGFSLEADIICEVVTPPTPGRSISYDVNDSRRHVRAYIGNSSPGTPGKVIIGLASNVVPLDWKDKTVPVMANRACIRWDRQSTGSMLYTLIELAGAIVLLKSSDEGNTWSTVATIGTGAHPALVASRDGRKFCFWVSGGAILGKILDGAGNTLKDTFTAIPSGVEDDEIATDEFVEARMKWRMTLMYRSGTSIVTKTSIDGVIFA